MCGGLHLLLQIYIWRHSHLSKRDDSDAKSLCHNRKEDVESHKLI